MSKRSCQDSEQDVAQGKLRWDPPIWGRTESGHCPERADGIIRAEVLVVGAGYAGLAAARRLAKAGRDVLVIEAAEVPAAGAASRNSGAVSGGFGLSKGLLGYQAIREGDVTQAELVSEAARSVKTLRDVIADEGIDCGLEWTGRLVAGAAMEELDLLKAQCDAWQELGIDGVAFIGRSQMAEETGTDSYGGGLRIADAGRLDSIMLAQGLVDACVRQGVRFLFGKRVHAMSQVASSVTCEWQGGQAIADHIVLATNGIGAPCLPGWERRLRPIVTCTLATEAITPGIASKILPARRTASDILPAYSYFRMTADQRHLVFGGRMAWPLNTASDWPQQLAARMRSLFPQLRDVVTAQAWNGIVVETGDMLPRSGIAGRIAYCMGCNGSGVAMMLHLGDRAAAMILGQEVESGCRLLPLPPELEIPPRLDEAVQSFFDSAKVHL